MWQQRCRTPQKLLAVSAPFLLLVSCSGKPFLWNFFAKGSGDDYWSSPFLVAAANGDTTKIKKLLASGTPPDGPRSDHGNTALHKAVEYRRYEVVKILIQAGADPDIEGYLETSIGRAVLLGDLQSFNLMKGRSNLTSLHHGYSLITTACVAQPFGPDEEAAGIVNDLIHAGCDPNFRDPGGETPLLRASNWQKEKVIQVLLTAGADPLYVGSKGESSWAIIKKSRDEASKGLSRHQEELRKYQAGDKTIFSADQLPEWISMDKAKLAECDRILAMFEGARAAPASK